MLEITVTMNDESTTYLANKLPFEIRCKGIVSIVIAEARPTQLAPDACPYCLGKGEEPLNKILVRCRFCAGTGKRG